MTPQIPEKEYSLISLDLASNQAAVDLAKKIAAKIGRAVTVRDADGFVIAVVSAPMKN